MPSAKSILLDYENLFKRNSYPNFLSKLFSEKKKSLPPVCPFCKILVKDKENRLKHNELCLKLHIVHTARYEILLLVSLEKNSDLLRNHMKLLAEIEEKIEIEGIKWKLKYHKSLDSCLSINLSDFQFIKPITKGGFGQVFLIKDKFSDKLMCAKIISISEAIHRSCLLAYASERKYLLKCESNYITFLYYSFKSECFIYQIMEYMEGGDLSANLEQVGRFSETLVKNILVNILLALQELERNQIVHGDIKLENILYSYERKIVKLADFGLAFDSKNSSEMSNKGTPEYMAPEQILNGRKGKESDIWAVGVCAYEMIFGIPPYYDINPESIFSKVLSSEPIDWSDSNISYELKDLISKLLDKNYQNRISLKDVIKHSFFNGINWSNPPQIEIAKGDEIFDIRNRRYNTLNYYNMATISTETVVFENSSSANDIKSDDQLELSRLFPIKNLNRI